MGMEDLFQTNAVAAAAGTQTATSGTVIFSNSNNITFGLDGQTLTASFAGGPGGGGVAISAGTESATSGTVVFSNSNGVTFGMSDSTVTASIATSLTNIRVSAGTTSNLLSAITFANGSNVSFGLNASTITASVASSLTNVNVSAGTTSNNLSAITFANGNNVSFGLDGSTLTGSVATSLTNVNVSAGTTSNNLPRDIHSHMQRGENVIEVNGIAMGCALWKMDLFRKMPQPWFVSVADVVPGKGAIGFTQDLYFCKHARQCGKRFGVDLRVKVGHLDKASGIVY